LLDRPRRSTIYAVRFAGEATVRTLSRWMATRVGRAPLRWRWRTTSHIGRGFRFSIGCIQALRCHTNTCPTGVTTQNQWLQSGLDPTDKGVRVRNYALALERDLQMIIHACGLTHPGQLHRGHVIMNISPGVRKSLVDLFPYPAAGQRAASRERAFQLETLVSK
jgi:hypothetical protein